MMDKMARISELERKYADNPRRYFAPLANEYRRAGDPERAISLCRSQLPEIPGHISGHIVLAQALYDSGDLADSRSTFEAALVLDPENILALRYLGDIGRQQGELADAEHWYERALEADPRNEAALLGLELVRGGAASAAPAEIEAAEEDSTAAAERVLELAAPFVTETMADLYLEQGYVTEALDLLKQLAEQRIGDSDLLDKIAAIESQSAAGLDARPAEIAQQETEFRDSGSHQGQPLFDPGIVPPARDLPSEPTALSELLPAGYGMEPPIDPDRAVFPELWGADEIPEEQPVEIPVERQLPQRTIRDFLIEMDRMRPRAGALAAAETPPSSGPLPFWTGEPARSEDESAAREMAGVFGQGSTVVEATQANPVAEGPAPAVPRVSGAQLAFDPATADMKDFDAWLRGLKTP